jgi:hypothetical protein
MEWTDVSGGGVLSTGLTVSLNAALRPRMCPRARLSAGATPL